MGSLYYEQECKEEMMKMLSPLDGDQTSKVRRLLSGSWKLLDLLSLDISYEWWMISWIAYNYSALGQVAEINVVVNV